MTRRAELVDETRRQITGAAALLHTTIGPANTSISSIAEKAGVTRLTVYRHFPDAEVLFEACRAHWRAENPPPDALAWLEVDDLEPRARRALGELYTWFGAHAEELYPLYRDMRTMPHAAQERMREDNRGLGNLLVSGHAPEGEAGRRIRAVARHLADYRTWRSLVIDRDLTDAEAVDLGVLLLVSLVDSGRPAIQTRSTG